MGNLIFLQRLSGSSTSFDHYRSTIAQIGNFLMTVRLQPCVIFSCLLGCASPRGSRAPSLEISVPREIYRERMRQ